jgi:lysophospholipase L1-like esterase
MKLQTQIPLSPEDHKIDYDSKVLLLGSCFSENIGGKLEYYKFQNLQNPFGIIFHPLPIEYLIHRALSSEDFNETDIFQQDGLWHCMEVHSLISHKDKDAFLRILNQRLADLSEYLKTATHIIITYGTARGYRKLTSGSIVANCHKLPQKEFVKEITSVGSIAESIENISGALKTINPNIRIIFTVSPVRHLKDGFIENTQSKAHLIAGIHEINRGNNNISYFPSYELMMDELRDYRFYSEDMLHPNTTAVAVIWDRFAGVWIDPSTEPIQKEIAAIRSGLEHRPFNPDSHDYKAFRQKLQQKINGIQLKLPHVSF